MLNKNLSFTLCIALGIFASACSDSSSSSPGPFNTGLVEQADSQTILLVASTTMAASTLALQAALNQIDPTNFQALQGPPATSATGNTTAGTVTLDFGAGTTINNSTFSGMFTSAYTAAGNSVSVSLNLTGLSIQTNSTGTAAATGILVVGATLNATSNITGTVTGTAALTNATDTITVTPNLTLALDGQTAASTLNGTSGIVHDTLGTWNATITNIVATQLMTATRTINSGAVSLVRQTAPSLTVDFNFTGANMGILSIPALGLTVSFTL
jgi:hypothetical protein